MGIIEFQEGEWPLKEGYKLIQWISKIEGLLNGP